MRNIATIGVGLLLAACILGFLVDPHSSQGIPWAHQSSAAVALAARQADVWVVPAQILLVALGSGLIAGQWLVAAAIWVVWVFGSAASAFFTLADGGLSVLVRTAVFRRNGPAHPLPKQDSF